MTKKLVSAAVIALAIAALAAALYILNQAPQDGVSQESSAPVEVLYVLGQQEAKFVKTVDVENASGGFTVNVDNAEAEKSADVVYSIKGLENRPEDRSYFINIATASAKLIATSLVSENAPDLSLFGLDKPAAKAKITYTDGTTDELHLGNDAPGSDGVYAKSAKNDNVYLVTKTNVERFYYSRLDFFSKQITGGDTEATLIETARLSGSVRADEILIEQADADSSQTFTFSTHYIKSPIDASMDTEKGMKALRTAFDMTATKVVGVASDDAAKEQFGLLTPYSVIYLETPMDENGDIIRFTASASQPDAEGMINIMTDATDLIYSMPAEGLGWIDVQVFDLMSKLVILPNINDVKTVTVKTMDSTTVFAIEGDEDNPKFTSGGKTLDTDSFRQFYQSLLSARFDSIPEQPMPEDAPFYMSYVYEYKNGGTPDVVTFHQGPARKLYVELNGGEAFFIPSSYADKILEDIPKLLAGQPVTSYL